VRALAALELLVVIDPCMTNTARLAHYILPPELQYERPAVSNMNIAYESVIRLVPFQQYTEAVSKPPPGAEVLDDALILWELAKRMDIQVVFDNAPLDMKTRPTLRFAGDSYALGAHSLSRSPTSSEWKHLSRRGTRSAGTPKCGARMGHGDGLPG